MFNFFTLTLLNSLDRVHKIDSTDDAGIPAGEDAVQIDHVGKFPQYNSVGSVKTTAVYKSEGTLPVKEIATLNLSTITLADVVGKVILLDLNIRLSGSEDAEYARWDVEKGQPFNAEYFVKTLPASATALAADLAASFNKGLKRAGHSLVNVTSSGANLIVTATNEYQRVQNFDLLLVQSAFDDMPGVLAEGTVTTPGKEGFGTDWFITKNLLLPTLENTRFMSPSGDEKPVYGKLYDQFTFHLTGADRKLGGSAVGQSVTSTTQHVVYVENSLTTAFEAMLTDILPSSGVIVAG